MSAGIPQMTLIIQIMLQVMGMKFYLNLMDSQLWAAELILQEQLDSVNVLVTGFH